MPFAALLLLGLLLQAAPAAATGASAPAAAAVSAPAAPGASEGEAPSAAGLEDLRHAYHDSCEVRLYGEYDDMCSELSDHIRRYRAALARAARGRPPG